MVYQVVVLGELLYATETWPAKQKDIRLEDFHHHCSKEHSGNKQDAAVCPARVAMKRCGNSLTCKHHWQ